MRSPTDETVGKEATITVNNQVSKYSMFIQRRYLWKSGLLTLRNRATRLDIPVHGHTGKPQSLNKQ